MQPTRRHVPPSSGSFSMQTTFTPSCPARIAAVYPPGPPPRTATSHSMALSLPHVGFGSIVQPAEPPPEVRPREDVCAVGDGVDRAREVVDGAHGRVGDRGTQRLDEPVRGQDTDRPPVERTGLRIDRLRGA